MLIELIGGPKDGESYEVPDSWHEMRIPMLTMHPMVWREMAEEIPTAPVKIRVGVYKRSHLKRHRGKMFWEGE